MTWPISWRREKRAASLRSRSDSFRAGAEGASWTNVAIERLYGAEDGEDFRFVYLRWKALGRVGRSMRAGSEGS